jgi:polo-like kinase 1
MTDGRDRELAHQKARIVSQMAGLKIHDKEERGEDRHSRAPSTSSGSTTTVRAPLREAGNVLQTGTATATDSAAASSAPAGRRSNIYDLVEANLTSALKMGPTDIGFRTPYIQAKPPKVFVVSWLDYCAKYGMGFAMTDGTVCVHFNDSTSLVLSPSKQHFDHIAPDADRTHEHRRNYPIGTYPADLKTRVYLLHQFEKYMLDRLVGNHQYTYVDEDKTRGMVYIEKYLRMKHVILFRLSNGLLQVSLAVVGNGKLLLTPPVQLLRPHKADPL